MYKYIRYIGIMLFIPFRKVFGLVWYFAVVPFRGYARNVVHNYVLQNDIYLPRLLERPIIKEQSRYIIQPYHGTQGGYIKYRYIYWLEYQLVFWLLWGWVDDDSNHDTMSGGKIDGMYFGNAFDLGDKRAKYPEFKFKESTKWLCRNTAYNFKYSLHECLPTNKNFFYFKFLGTHWGYLPNGSHKGRLVYFKEYWECKN